MLHIRKWMAALLTLTITACGGGGSGGESPTNMGTLLLTPETIVMVSGETRSMNVTGGTGPYRFQSSNPTIVSVPDKINNLNAAAFSITSGNVNETTDVEITVVDSKGATAKSTVTVEYKPLSMSPQTITLMSQSSQVFHLYGGRKPFTVSVSNPAYVTIDSTDLVNGTFKVTAALVAAVVHDVKITVTDAAGNSAVANLDLSPNYIFGSITALPLSANASDTTLKGGTKGNVAVQLSQSYLGIRALRFKVVSGPATMDGADVNGEVVVNTNQLGQATATFSTTASQGPAYIVFRVTDTASGTTGDLTSPLVGNNLAVTPSTFALGASCTGRVVGTITGGMPPYAIVSGFPDVVSVTPATVNAVGGTFTAQGLACGESTIVVRDSVNTTISIVVSSTAPEPVPVAALVVSPTAITQTYPVGSAACLGQVSSAVIVGGVPPYTVVGGNNSIATVAATGSSFSVTGVSCGSMEISVTDSIGSTPVSVVFTSAIGA